MNTLTAISYEIMVFMRGKYRLDEIGDGKDELKFKQGAKTILTIYTREDKYIFLIIFGKKEREIFETRKDEFSQYIKDYYEKSKTYHDGKWMFIEVTTLEQLEEVKKLIMIKKKPNRKPFTKEGAVYSLCGHRCDLCIHYTGISEEQRQIYGTHVKNIWFHGKDNPESDMRCGGCGGDNWYRKDDLCDQMKCATNKGLAACVDCCEYPCRNATVADCRQKIHTDSYTADDITYGILPYMPYQMEHYGGIDNKVVE